MDPYSPILETIDANNSSLKGLESTLPPTDFQTFLRPWAYDLGYEKAWFISRKFVS